MWIVKKHTCGEWKIVNTSTGEEHYFLTKCLAIREASQANEVGK